MSIALRGNLTDFGLAEVFQLIGQQRKTGSLDVESGGRSMRLWFDSGAVVWASPDGGNRDAVLGERLVRCGLLRQDQLDELWRASESSARPIGVLAVDAEVVSAEDIEQIEELITDETIFVVLRCTGGSFDFTAQGVKHSRPPEKLLAAEQILMDGLRKVDEWQTFAALVPSAETVFEPTGKLSGLREQGEAVESVHALIDGRLPVQRIIDLSRLGLFDATRALAELHQGGFITPLSGRLGVGRARGGVDARPVVAQVRWWLAAAFPLALLSLLVSNIVSSTPSPEGLRVFPIERAPLEQARAAFEKRRLQHTLEADRMRTGAWPASLDAAAAGAASGDALTSADPDEYYYSSGRDGIILLAPAR